MVPVGIDAGYLGRAVRLTTRRHVWRAARAWLVRHDPEGAALWHRTNGRQALAALHDNLRDFGVEPDGQRILSAAKRVARDVP